MVWDIVQVRGASLFVHPDEDLSNHIKREQDYFEAPILDYLRDNHNEQGTIVDIGANIGNHTIYFTRFLKYDRIVAVEPLYDNFVLLVNNVVVNGDVLHTTLLNSGLSDEYGTANFQRNTSNMGAGEIRESGTEKIVIYPLDSLKLDNVTLLKIDVEYHEPAVLGGAAETIEKWKPLILLEDSEYVYSSLLPHYYGLKKAWPEHKTYLYGV
jgi:FkbM family methyltransferase